MNLQYEPQSVAQQFHQIHSPENHDIDKNTNERIIFQRYPNLPQRSFSLQPQFKNQAQSPINNYKLPHHQDHSESPLSLPTINNPRQQNNEIDKKLLIRSSNRKQLFAKNRLEQILSKNQSQTSHETKMNRVQLRPFKSFKKLNQVIPQQQNSLKYRRQRQLKELRKSPNDEKSTSHNLNLINPPQKYKNIKPRLMNHTQKILPSVPTLSEVAIPELQSSQVMSDYKILSHVGKGGFSVVSAAINKKNMTKYAIKTYTKINQMQNYKILNIQSEVRNLFALKHQNIINLQHAVKDGKKIQLIMENGGKQSLSGLLRKVKNFDEHIARKYFKQVVKAIAFCHQNNICHRDLKLQNILVDDNGLVKIIDFGFSARCKSQGKLNSFCGTPPYMSPQLAAKVPYNGMSSDIWALGVTLYLLTVGKFPFRAGNEKQLYRLIQQGKYKTLDTMSQPLKQLLAKILKVDQKQRAKAHEILESQWLNKKQNME